MENIIIIFMHMVRNMRAVSCPVMETLNLVLSAWPMTDSHSMDPCNTTLVRAFLLLTWLTFYDLKLRKRRKSLQGSLKMLRLQVDAIECSSNRCVRRHWSSRWWSTRRRTISIHCVKYFPIQFTGNFIISSNHPRYLRTSLTEIGLIQGPEWLKQSNSNALLNSDSVIEVICLGLKSLLMEQRLVLSDVSLTIQDITINVESIQELFKSWNNLLHTLQPSVGFFWTCEKMASRVVDGTKMSMVGEVANVKDLTRTGLNVMAVNLVIVHTASVRVPR